MIPELGQFSLVLATVLSVVLGVLPLWGTLNRNTVWQSLARPTALLQFALVLVSFICLSLAFLSNDFSVKYVAEHSNRLLPKAPTKSVYRGAGAQPPTRTPYHAARQPSRSL